VGKIFKALQKSKKRQLPEMPRTSRARGVQRSEEDLPKKAQPEKKTPPPDKPVKPDDRPAAVKTRETDLGAIHGLLAGEPVTEAPGTDITASADTAKRAAESAEDALSSIYEMIGDRREAKASMGTAADRKPGKEEAEAEPIIDLVDEVLPHAPAEKEKKPVSAKAPPAPGPAATDSEPAKSTAPKPSRQKTGAQKVITLKEPDSAGVKAKKTAKAAPGQAEIREAGATAVLRNLEYENVDHSLVTLLKPRSFESEQFKLLRTNLMFPISGRPPKSILITSALPGDGKSFVASNLAISFALNLDRRVLLIDCDIRKPDVHDRFGFKPGAGLSDFLTKGTPLPSLLMKTSLPNLTILPAGRPPHNPSELLSSEKMPALLKEVTARYADRYVIIDSPPPKLTAETGVLARLVDGIVLVLKTGSTRREMVEELVELIGKDKILGVIMNHYDIKASRYYGYGKYGRYGKYYTK